MANHKSALKRARQNEVRRIRNKSTKTRIKNIVKDVRLDVSEKSKESALTKLDTAKSIIDKAAKKGVIHKKTASRKISRLSKNVNAISA
ncbi:MAG: 30S ribosomal protein S20 [Deltaproteobacteria bacterium]|nr:30S ribosomal protein S20 [Deltaproteobacteria bacterium]MDX2496838.1 30S ribosomal protein S20 [Desulfobacterales bacterium]MBW1827150.1 30S ribosomal protein S20 [Deltaproteobacteria bacterium]MBW1968186.1 30S ribosomal protein S20 [Deltaproteobacteria bacterium]MBW2155533.1 30S ribosomal protein S20 [Deltaproteobacteria bacterium]